MPDKSNTAEQGSVLDRLRTIRTEFQAETTHDIDVPGYRGRLVARYAPLPWEIVRGLANKAEKGKRNAHIAVVVASDGLANAIVGFFFRDDDGKLAPVTLHGEPVTQYGDALAQALGIIGAETPREIVKAVFPDEYALVAHYGAFSEWQAERDEEDEDGIGAVAKADDAVHPMLTSSREPQSSE
jgi:hypothetical protein